MKLDCHRIGTSLLTAIVATIAIAPFAKVEARPILRERIDNQPPQHQPEYRPHDRPSYRPHRHNTAAVVIPAPAIVIQVPPRVQHHYPDYPHRDYPNYPNRSHDGGYYSRNDVDRAIASGERLRQEIRRDLRRINRYGYDRELEQLAYRARQVDFKVREVISELRTYDRDYYRVRDAIANIDNLHNEYRSVDSEIASRLRYLGDYGNRDRYRRNGNGDYYDYHRGGYHRYDRSASNGDLYDSPDWDRSDN
jgi:hypothetical protein